MLPTIYRKYVYYHYHHAILNNSHRFLLYLTKFICENPWMSLACSLVWLQPLTQSAAYTWMPILPIWRYALWTIYHTLWNNWKPLPVPWCLLCKGHQESGFNTDHCTMSGPHHSHTTRQPWSHSKTSWPRGPIGGFKQLLGCSYHKGLQTKDLCAREAVFSHCGLSCLMWLWRVQKRLLILDRKDSCQNTIKRLLLTSLRADRYKMIQNEHIELEDHSLPKLHGHTHPFDPMLERNVAYARPDEAEKAHATISASINAGTGTRVKTLWLMISIDM